MEALRAERGALLQREEEESEAIVNRLNQRIGVSVSCVSGKRSPPDKNQTQKALEAQRDDLRRQIEGEGGEGEAATDKGEHDDDRTA